MENEERLDNFLKLPRKAQTLIIKFEFFDILDNYYLSSCNDLELSPIEQIYLVAFLIVRKIIGAKFIIEPQYPVECGEKDYYVDFAICHYECLEDELKENFKLVIECDGYEFHQKTKEQVEKDNQREYDIKMQGFEVLRFSGREIYNDAIECAIRTMNYILKKNHLMVRKNCEG